MIVAAGQDPEVLLVGPSSRTRWSRADTAVDGASTVHRAATHYNEPRQDAPKTHRHGERLNGRAPAQPTPTGRRSVADAPPSRCRPGSVLAPAGQAAVTSDVAQPLLGFLAVRARVATTSRSSPCLEPCPVRRARTACRRGRPASPRRPRAAGARRSPRPPASTLAAPAPAAGRRRCAPAARPRPRCRAPRRSAPRTSRATSGRAGRLDERVDDDRHEHDVEQVVRALARRRRAGWWRA